MRHVFTFGVIAFAAVACGGVSSIGGDKGPVDGKDGGTGGGVASGGGGSSAGGQPGSGGDPGKGGTAGAGAVVGAGGSTFLPECKTAAECAVPQVCQVCPGGGFSCAQADCIGGKCQVSYPPCPGGGSGGVGGGTGATCDPSFCPFSGDPNAKPCCVSASGPCGEDSGQGCFAAAQCATDRDCPIPPVACVPCPDGSCQNALTQCLKGACTTTFLKCGGGATPLWWDTCGPPVCSTNPPPSGLPACGPKDASGNPCPKDGAQCDTGRPCAGPLTCSTTPINTSMCPISRAKYKRDIEYVSRDERAKLASDIQSIPLVRYRYKDGPEREHLGFIIEDIEPSPSVDSKHDQVDLYGYTSMAVAALQQQHAEIEALKHEVEGLKAALRSHRGK